MTELVHITHGVWRPRILAADCTARIAAILTALAPGTVVCGPTAARLHGLWLPDRTAVGPIEVIVRPTSRRRATVLTASGRDCSSAATPCARTRQRTWTGYRTRPKHVRGSTSPARSALPTCWRPATRRCAGSATLGELDVVMSRAARRRGVVVARAVLPLLDPRSRSRPESHLRYSLVIAGLPRPEVNVAVHDAHGGWPAEADPSYADVRLALEYVGADHAEVKRMRKDISRGIDLSSSGWRTEVFGPVEVFSRPDQVAALVRRLRAERARFAHPEPGRRVAT